ncbi:MAG: glutamate--tRNA ligase [Candidatus Woykebacteria bacterium]
MIKTRIAPSPTGDPHIGTAYSALFNYAFAKKNKGRFILRIEDTDRTRLVQESEQKIIDSLNWLGIKWDEGPFKQSQRLHLYQKEGEKLVKTGAAYYCDCSPERLDKVRKQQRAEGDVPRYDKKCRHNPAKNLKKGSFVIRLKVPEEGETSFEDLSRGKISFKNKDIDDAVLLKSDSWPTYHLAVVVDDSDMGVSHVIRAEEWLSSTPKHVLIYNAFQKKLPVYAHLPLLRNPDRSKISKRKNPVSLSWYKNQGYLPEALLNYLSLMGWSMPDGREKFNLREFIDDFDFSRVDPAGPVFDLKKLEWLNGEWIRGLENRKLVDALLEYTKIDEKQISKVLPLVRERLKILSEFDNLTSYFFSEPAVEKAEIVPRTKTPTETKDVLKEIGETLSEIGRWSKGDIEKALLSKPQETGWSKTELFQTIRYIETGSRATPPLFDTLEVIGKEKSLERIQKAIRLLNQ